MIEEEENKEQGIISRHFTFQADLIRSRRSFLLRLDKDRKDAEEEVESLLANPDLEWEASSPGKAGRRVLEGYVRMFEANLLKSVFLCFKNFSSSNYGISSAGCREGN